MIDGTILKFNIILFLRALMLLSPVLLFFYQENGLTKSDLFLFQGVFYAASILFDFPVGYFANIFSRKHIILFAFFLFFIVSALWILFKGYYIVLAGEIIFALTKTIIDNVPSAYLYDYLKIRQKNMVTHWGYSNFYISAGTAVGAVVGAYLYKMYGSAFVLKTECVLIAVGIYLISTLPNITSEHKREETIKNKIKAYMETTVKIYKKEALRYYIIYSGIFASCSALFALFFQPLMKDAAFPVVMFGVVSFLNHFIRSCAGFITGKWLSNVRIKRFIIPLFILYLCAFGAIFVIFENKNIVLDFCLIATICLIIGVQLSFLILHISRLHRFVPFEQRGTLMAVNNCTARLISAAVLMLSGFFTRYLDLKEFFTIVFPVFIIFGSYFMIKTYRVKEDA